MGFRHRFHRHGIARGIVAAALLFPVAGRAEPPVVTVSTRVLAMRDDVVPPIMPGLRAFSWSVRSGFDDPEHQAATPEPGSPSDPTTAGASGGGALLVVYNSAGSGEQVTIPLPAERWQLQGNPTNGIRYVYAGEPGVDPVWKVWLKRTKITVRGGKQPWTYSLDELSQGSIAIRLTLGTGVTYCANVPAQASGSPPSTARFDQPGRFKGQPKTPPPTSCPPLP